MARSLPSSAKPRIIVATATLMAVTTAWVYQRLRVIVGLTATLISPISRPVVFAAELNMPLSMDSSVRRLGPPTYRVRR